MDTTLSATHRLADILLGDSGPLEEFVRSRRARYPKRAWRLIERDLLDATDRQIDISFETLRTWFPDAPTEPSEASA